MKKLWRNNKIFMILGMILMVCLVAIIVVVLTYFVGSRKSKFGDRFTNMKHVISNKEQNDYVKVLEANSIVEKVSLRVSHKTLYVTITYKDDAKLDDAKKVVDASLESLSQEVKETYDINYTIKGATFNTLMGARNATGTGLLWTNNTPVENN